MIILYNFISFLYLREKEYESMKLTIALKENNLKKDTIIESLKKEVCTNLNFFFVYCADRTKDFREK